MQSAFAVGQTNFAFDLLREVHAGAADGAVQVSPFSVRRALTMAALGARRSTKQAFLDTFRLPKRTSLRKLCEDNKRVLQWLMSAENNPENPTEFTAANALWLRGAPGFAFLPRFLQSNQEFFDATIEADLPFDDSTVQKINAWVKQKTKKIDRILDKCPDDAQAFLTDACYLKTPAQKPFEKGNDTTADFTLSDGKRVPMTYMVNPWDSFQHFAGDGVQVLRFPFGSRGVFNYYVVLPDKADGLPNLVKKMTGDTWRGWKASLRDAEGRLMMPPNEQKFDIDVKDALANMGLSIAFDDEQADFLDMCTGRLKIGAVKHKTYTKLLRGGFEGAAITLVSMVACGAAFNPVPKPTFDMRVDRPYLWVVEGGDEVLFAATTTNPVKPEGFDDEADEEPRAAGGRGRRVRSPRR